MPRLLQSVVWTDVRAMQWAQLVRQGSVILAAVLLAQSGLSAQEIGRYEQLQYLAALLSAAWVSGFIQGLLSYHARLSEAGKDRLIFSVGLVFSVLSLAVAVLLWIGPGALWRALIGQAQPAYLAWFALYLLGNVPANLQEYFYLLYHRPKAIVWYSSLHALALIACVVLPPFLGYPFEISFQWLAVLGLLRLGWLWLFLYRHTSMRWGRTEWNDWRKLSGPLIVYALLALANQYVDIWWVGQFYAGDEGVFAIYRYGARELPLVTALSAALGSAMLPKLSGDMATQLPELKRQSRRLLHLFFPLAILLSLFSPWWFPAVFSAVFFQSIVIFNLFMLIGVSRMVFSLTIVLALQQNRVALWAIVFSLLLHLLLSGLLAYPFGLAGIALGTVLSFSAEKLFLAIYLQRRHGIRVGQYTDIPMLTGYTLLLLGAFGFSLMYL